MYKISDIENIGRMFVRAVIRYLILGALLPNAAVARSLELRGHHIMPFTQFQAQKLRYVNQTLLIWDRYEVQVSFKYLSWVFGHVIPFWGSRNGVFEKGGQGSICEEMETGTEVHFEGVRGGISGGWKCRYKQSQIIMHLLRSRYK